MKRVRQSVASAVASTVASILATWLLRRIVYSSESMRGEQPGEQHAPVWVFMPMVIVIGNNVGTPPFAGKPRGPLAKVRRRRGQQ